MRESESSQLSNVSDQQKVSNRALFRAFRDFWTFFNSKNRQELNVKKTFWAFPAKSFQWGAVSIKKMSNSHGKHIKNVRKSWKALSQFLQEAPLCYARES